MRLLLSVRCSSGNYDVESYSRLRDAINAAGGSAAYFLVDQYIYENYRAEFDSVSSAQVLPIIATEEQKSFESLSPLFVWLLENGLRRDGTLVVVGGGVLQDIGCFIASVLFRGIKWNIIPTTLLAQCDSCIGSKSSINIQRYKNQIGTFYPPNRVLLTTSVLETLPPDEIRSGLGEVLKLHLLAGEKEFDELLADLAHLSEVSSVLDRAVKASLLIKKPYIENDEFDRGVRNLLNYGHTFGHAYESVTNYAIPHGIAVTLGMLTATYVSYQLKMVDEAYYRKIKQNLQPWYEPYDKQLGSVPLSQIVAAIKLDKKNTRDGVNCILTRGAGRMEKTPIGLHETLVPALTTFLQVELGNGLTCRI